jgi:hypothetical protein
MKLIKFPFLMLVLTVFFACGLALNDEESQTYSTPTPSIKYPPTNNDLINIGVPSSTKPYNKPVQKVSFSGGTSTVTLNGLENHSVYLVKTNKGGALVSPDDTGKVLNMGIPQDVLAKNARNAVSVTQEPARFMGGGGDKPVSGIFMGPNGETIIRYEHHPNNEKIFDAINAGNLNARSVSRSVGAEYSSTPPNYTVGSSPKIFFVQNESGTVFGTVATTLRAAGTYSNVWVADENYDNDNSEKNDIYKNKDNKITTAQAQALADKFDIIYQKETPVFGFEKGGGLFNGISYYGDGGVDGDPKIQILVYDIFDDHYPAQQGGVLGYFWAGDEFPNSYNIPNSNKAEMFYIDAHFTDLMPDAIYSTLAHEFQHMINFNVKYLSSSSPKPIATWYNEMLSMLAEDLIGPFIGINADNGSHPIQSRIPTFLSNYYKVPTVWLSGYGVYASYANAYALGAYLVRNFGGIDFVRAVMLNSAVDIASLTLALASSVNPLHEGVNNFNTAISRYGEALLFNQSSENRPAGVLSFNNTVTKTMLSDEYTFYGFDLYSLGNGYKINDIELKGPLVWDAAKNYSLEPYTVLLLSNNGWQNKTGDLSITLQQPADPNIEFHIIVR